MWASPPVRCLQSPDSLFGKYYTKGCSWSPDGTCLLVGSDDNTIRLFELPEEVDDGQGESLHVVDLPQALSVHEAETVYDYQWYPLMDSNDPTMCCFASTSRDTPVHLWDAFTGTTHTTRWASSIVGRSADRGCVQGNCGQPTVPSTRWMKYTLQILSPSIQPGIDYTRDTRQKSDCLSSHGLGERCQSFRRGAERRGDNAI